MEVREAAARPVVWRAWWVCGLGGLEVVVVVVVVEVGAEDVGFEGLEEEMAERVRDILSLLEARASGLMLGSAILVLGFRIEAPLPRAAVLTFRDGSLRSRCCSGVAVSAPS